MVCFPSDVSMGAKLAVLTPLNILIMTMGWDGKRFLLLQNINKNKGAMRRNNIGKLSPPRSCSDTQNIGLSRLNEQFLVFYQLLMKTNFTLEFRHELQV